MIERGKGICGLGAALLVALLLAFPAAAGAQEDCAGPTGDQYCPKTEILTGSGGDSADPQDPGSASASGGLPFTGFDVALSLVAGAGLLGAGLVMRRAARDRDAGA
jgi:hypothetical protein